MDLLNPATVRRIISDIESSQNRDRREREIKAFEVYSGDLKHHVEQRIKEIYPKTYGSFSVADLNMSKKIIDKLAKAYKKSPIRELGTDKENDEYSFLMANANAAAAWQTFDIYYNLHRYAAMWFNFVERDGERKIVFRPLAPFQFSRITNDLGETKVFIVNFPTEELFTSEDTDGLKSSIQDSMQDSGRKRYALWTDTQHVVVSLSYEDESFNVFYEEIPGNEDNINELGIIPAAFAQQGDNAALPITNPLTNQVVEFNQQYSVMLTGSSLQTFGHLVLSHPADQPMPDEIYNSLFTYSRLPQVDGEIATTLDYLNPAPNLDAQLQVLQNYGHQILSEHLGSGSQNIQGSDNFTSGLDRMIAMSDVTNMIESNQQVYAKVEDAIYQVIKHFYEAVGQPMFKTDNLTVKYTKAKPIESEAEILANIEKKLQLGLIEKYEALIQLDANMTAEAAKEKIERINEENQKSINEMFGEPDADQKE